MLVPNRHGGTDYRYGYQGSEKDDEIKGAGNSYTTKFRLLDPRVGRWMSRDPKASKMPWQSPYISMDGNPIMNNDPNGDIVPLVAAAGGFVIGAGVDFTGQVFSNFIAGEPLLKNIDYGDVFVSGLEVGTAVLTGGMSLAAHSGFSATRVAVDVTAEDGVKTIGGFAGKSKTLGEVMGDMMGESLGVLGGKLIKEAPITKTVKEAVNNTKLTKNAKNLYSEAIEGVAMTPVSTGASTTSTKVGDKQDAINAENERINAKHRPKNNAQETKSSSKPKVSSLEKRRAARRGKRN